MTDSGGDRLLSAYYAAQRWIAPDLKNSQYQYHARLRQELASRRSWLDLGCGHSIVPAWFPAHLQTMDLPPLAVGIDEDSEALRRQVSLRYRVEGNIEQLPFRDNRFDLVTANMVIEHVRRPLRLFTEVARVLAPGGCFLLHTPNVHGYTTLLTQLVPSDLRPWLAERLQGRSALDVYPTFYRANSAQQLHRLTVDGELIVRNLTYVHSSPQLARTGFLAVPELLLIRLLSWRALRRLRACLIVLCEKPVSVEGRATTTGLSLPRVETSHVDSCV